MKRAKYAVNTDVPAKRTRDEIETILMKFGAESFAYGTEAGSAVIMFVHADRRIRFRLPLPNESSVDKTERRHREMWRALLLSIKAKLVSVDTGIETFEEAFLAHIMLADGQTVADAVAPSIAEQYKTGRVVPLLEGPRK
jgi:hypothetical protein